MLPGTSAGEGVGSARLLVELQPVPAGEERDIAALAGEKGDVLEPVPVINLYLLQYGVF